MPNQQRPGHRPAAVSQHRRDFLRQSGALALAASGLPLVSGGLIDRIDKQTPAAVEPVAESIVHPERTL